MYIDRWVYLFYTYGNRMCLLHVCVCMLIKNPCKKHVINPYVFTVDFVCFTRSKQVLSLLFFLYYWQSGISLLFFSFRKHMHSLLNIIRIFLKFTFFSSVKMIEEIKRTILVFTVLFHINIIPAQ